ncbi:MAG: hypothetical protein KDD46_08965 [Bdellovibrionales bacterium]|nr:hypothetical protein [Bdellovibrionales bacterium]
MRLWALYIFFVATLLGWSFTPEAFSSIWVAKKNTETVEEDEDWNQVPTDDNVPVYDTSEFDSGDYDGTYDENEQPPYAYEEIPPTLDEPTDQE